MDAVAKIAGLIADVQKSFDTAWRTQCALAYRIAEVLFWGSVGSVGGMTTLHMTVWLSHKYELDYADCEEEHPHECLKVSAWFLYLVMVGASTGGYFFYLYKRRRIAEEADEATPVRLDSFVRAREEPFLQMERDVSID